MRGSRFCHNEGRTFEQTLIWTIAKAGNEGSRLYHIMGTHFEQTLIWTIAKAGNKGELTLPHYGHTF